MFNQMNNNRCPRVTQRIKRQKQPNWITSEIVNVMRRRDFEEKRLNNAEYRKLRNKCKLMIRNSKTTFYKETIHKCKNDPRELVKCFNDLGVKNVDHDKINKIRHKRIFTENVKDIVNLFNYNFVNIGAKYATVFLQQTHNFCPIKLEQLIEQRVPPNVCFKIPLISHQFVFKYINEMKGSKSTGHDDISARFNSKNLQ